MGNSAFSIDDFYTDVRVSRISGAPGLGCPALRVALVFGVRGRRDGTSPAKLVQLSGSVFVVGPSRLYLGNLIPDGAPVFLQERTEHIEQAGQLRVELNSSRLEAIEAARGGGDLRITFELWGLVQRDSRVVQARADLEYSIPQSEWTRALSEMGYQERLLLELPVPSSNAPEDLARAVDDIRNAQQSMISGEYRDVVAKCRHALELLDHVLASSESELPPFSWQPSTDEDHNARLRRLRTSLKNVTHPAHHSDARSGGIEYTRRDAVLALSMTVALLSRYTRPPE